MRLAILALLSLAACEPPDNRVLVYTSPNVPCYGGPAACTVVDPPERRRAGGGFVPVFVPVPNYAAPAPAPALPVSCTSHRAGVFLHTNCR